MKDDSNEQEIRPWGQYHVLMDTDNYKVKHIEVNPGGRLSYQYHNYRSEIWTIVSGIALVTLKGVEKTYRKGDSVVIPLGAKHRVHNTGAVPLEIIEVQLGTYFGEDDIIRLEDDYSRGNWSLPFDD